MADVTVFVTWEEWYPVLTLHAREENAENAEIPAELAARCVEAERAFLAAQVELAAALGLKMMNGLPWDGLGGSSSLKAVTVPPRSA